MARLRRAARILVGVATGAAVLASASVASPQVRSVPASRLPQYANTVGFGASYGPFLDRDADFWGLAVDYGRRLGGAWSVGTSLAVDRETDRSSEALRRTDTLSAVVVVNFSLRRLTLTSGLSKGFADTDRSGGGWSFVNGDWGTGLILGVSLPSLSWSPRLSITLSAGYEYNLSAREPDLSFDVGLGYAF